MAYYTDTEATKEAVDLLTHNAINLASKTGEVLHYIEIVSATGKVLPSNTDMLSNGMYKQSCEENHHCPTVAGAWGLSRLCVTLYMLYRCRCMIA